MANKEFIIEEEAAFWEREGKQFEKEPFDFDMEVYIEAEVVEAVESFIVRLKDDNKISSKVFSKLVAILASAIFDEITVDEMVDQVTKIYAKPDIWEVLVDCGYFPF